jgi:hypothetical protein
VLGWGSEIKPFCFHLVHGLKFMSTSTALLDSPELSGGNSRSLQKNIPTSDCAEFEVYACGHIPMQVALLLARKPPSVLLEAAITQEQ